MKKNVNDQFQRKWFSRFKHVKFSRMESINPDQLCILSDQYYFNPKTHENS